MAPSPYSRAEVGNIPSRAVAPRTGFRMEGEQWSGLLNKGVRRDSWIGALLPSDLGLPGTHACLPAPDGLHDSPAGCQWLPLGCGA